MPAFEVLYGRCDEEELFPFGPWIDMLRPRLARMPQPELAELVRGAPELARLLPEIHERLPDLAGLPPAGEPETRRRQMFGAVVTVVRRLAAHGPGADDRRRPALGRPVVAAARPPPRAASRGSARS